MKEQLYQKPITYDELYEKVKRIIKKDEELDIIHSAYAFALEHHSGKKRLNGDDYISHPLEVANILLDLNCDYITIAAALNDLNTRIINLSKELAITNTYLAVNNYYST